MFCRQERSRDERLHLDEAGAAAHAMADRLLTLSYCLVVGSYAMDVVGSYAMDVVD